MKIILIGLSKLVGVVLMVLAFLQWVTFDYPDLNPFWPGAIFNPGMLFQFFNWLIVCILGASGWALFSVGKLKPNSK